ncbi:fructokinase [Capnocytophaga stomatis]|uniref:Carbohydrate kinase n=1 Tax=Capnocytophaga stomatis TaxID=1848904 RepID=A0A250FXI6_9FLAO|nr:carbohydrate kinase [Capnocytophaga stomatis]ATA89830.1 carbohydrate kinase [Capnocytophaga stomatis]GIJ95939.1 fructokinase [Capnocytophaga stomatis]
MEHIVVGLGEILWDVFPERKVMGGAPANFAYHASQFGLNGHIVSAIGNDVLGKTILENLNEKKLNHLLEEVPYPTGTIQISLSGEGIPQYEICENVAWDNIPFTEETKKLAEKTQTVCFGSLAQRSETSRSTIQKFLQAMPSDSLKVFDINLRLDYYTKEIIHQSLELSNILKLNDEEIIIIANLFNMEGTEREVCEQLLERYNLKVLILTKGASGSYIFTPSQLSFLPSPKINVVDTVGAGDSFTASFIAAYLKGKPISKAHRLAVEISAYVCQQHGAMPKFPDSLLKSFGK